VFVVVKLCSRKKPAATMRYVANNLGQPAKIRMQTARIIAAAVGAAGGSGKNSAAIIPVTANNVRVTNG
jgi:hypothetical protein